mmetsp:Transcript_81074/g.262551  ORF Transcript_81074/g.262551 Transcript_81074/m.262551 type:complete len:505 (-) Transcript_81074:32-1546(-)
MTMSALADDYNFRPFFFISLGGLLFGYIIGITGNVVTSGQLQCPDGWTGPVGSWTSVGYRQCYYFSSLEVGLLASQNLLGAFLSSLVCFKFADDLGRKLEVQIGGVLYLIGAAVAALSPVLWGVYAGFAIYGLGIGFAMHAAPVYIAEISTAKVRGTLISGKEVMIVFGMFLGFSAGVAFHDLQFQGWRFMIGAAALVAAVMEVGIAFVAESPRFLVLKEVSGAVPDEACALRGEAAAALQRFRCGVAREEVEQELAAIREELKTTAASAASSWEALKYPRPLVIGCGLVLLQQVTGQPSVLFFATNIFKSAGFGAHAAAMSSLGVGGVKLLATLFTVWQVDNYGRRPLLFVGIAMMTAGLAILSAAFCFRACAVPGLELWECNANDMVLPERWASLTVAGLMVYVSGYQVGFGPITWLMIAEVFPLQVRGSALSLAAMVNFGSNLLMTLLQGVLQETLTPEVVFMGYLGMCIVSFQFVYTFVPETRGKTLEEIERLMVAHKGE